MAKSTNPMAGGSAGPIIIESVADILERDLDAVIQEWLARVDKEPDLTAIPLSFDDRTGNLPHFYVMSLCGYVWTTKPRLRFRRRRLTTEIYAPNKATRWPWRWRNLGCSR